MLSWFRLSRSDFSQGAPFGGGGRPFGGQIGVPMVFHVAGGGPPSLLDRWGAGRGFAVVVVGRNFFQVLWKQCIAWSIAG